jgi:hypothetical protein
VAEFRTFSRDVVALRSWLTERGVTQVAMEAMGRFDEHHALLARMHLDHIDAPRGIGASQFVCV